MEQMITCINCPVGCRMKVTLNDAGEVLKVEGNTCPRGEKYARQECTLPERMITAVMPAVGSSVPLSVKTASPVPKHLISAVMAELKKVQVTAPVQMGETVIANVCGTGVDVIATRSV
mgnify:FL=1